MGVKLGKHFDSAQLLFRGDPSDQVGLLVVVGRQHGVDHRVPERGLTSGLVGLNARSSKMARLCLQTSISRRGAGSSRS